MKRLHMWMLLPKITYNTTKGNTLNFISEYIVNVRNK